MKPIVIYATRSGNTEKVAKTIAATLKCSCLQITDKSFPDLNGYDMVFVGTGIYRGQPHADLQSYLQQLNSRTNRRFALFMTCFGWGKGIADRNVIETLEGIFESKGQRLLSNAFVCFGGGLGFVKRGHPDASELTQAQKWAQQIATA